SAGLGRRGTVLSESGGAGADRHGSHRQLSLAGGFAERVGSRAVGGRCGADSCQLRAAAEDGQARCGAYTEAAGGGAVSEGLDRGWKRRKPQFVTIPSFTKSICIAATRSRKRWPRWQRRASWRYGCTGCCARRGRIRISFASRAARGCPWSARARPKELIGRSRIPHRRDVRIAESWPSVRSNRWLVERLHRRVIQVRFPESWSSTFSGEKAVLTHRPGYFCL